MDGGACSASSETARLPNPAASAGITVNVVIRVTSNPRRRVLQFHSVWNNNPVATSSNAESATSPAITRAA